MTGSTGWIKLPPDLDDELARHRLTIEERWHYVATVSLCSQCHAYDGVVRLIDAKRCSDVPEPYSALVRLAAVGLIEAVSSTHIRVVDIARFLPSPGTLRDRDRRRSTHILYRLFDADGALLYVGRTNSLRHRMSAHAKQQPWWGQVARRETEMFGSSAELGAAEREAIIREKPRYNVVHNDGHGDTSRRDGDRTGRDGKEVGEPPLSEEEVAMLNELDDDDQLRPDDPDRFAHLDEAS